MHLEDGYQDVFFFSTYALGIVILSSLASWKGRNPLSWGLIGGLLFPTSLIFLLVESHLCPKCKGALTAAEWKVRKCPICGTLARSKHKRSSIPAHEGAI